MPYEATARDEISYDLFETVTPAQLILRSFKPRELEIDGVVLKTTPAFDTYWYFACARQNIFHSRVSGETRPTNSPEDPILRDYRFTNAYRASDRVSQYLIRYVIDEKHKYWSSEDLFFRTMLFKIFNKIETWEALQSELGELSSRRFDYEKANSLLSARQDQGERNYSAAYIMPSAGSVFGHKRKHSNHLALIKWMLEQDYPSRIQASKTMGDAYAILLNAPSLGPFLAYQFVTDLNYSPLTNFSEMEFVVAGPGAHDGIAKCFENTDGVSSERIIKHVASNQSYYFDQFRLDFNDLWGRPLQLIDCQNLFCEISKYTRVAFPTILGTSGRTRIKQSYKISSRPMYYPTYPEKWNVELPSDPPCGDPSPQADHGSSN